MLTEAQVLPAAALGQRHSQGGRGSFSSKCHRKVIWAPPSHPLQHKDPQGALPWSPLPPIEPLPPGLWNFQLSLLLGILTCSEEKPLTSSLSVPVLTPYSLDRSFGAFLCVSPPDLVAFVPTLPGGSGHGSVWDWQ